MSKSEGMDKENRVCIHNTILFNDIVSKQNVIICDMEEPRRNYVEQKKKQLSCSHLNVETKK